MLTDISLAVALTGSAIAGLYDLKTTEIPNRISLTMIITGLLINSLQSIIELSPVYVLQSLAVGSSFFTLGFLMYLGGQWGGGDAKILTAIGFLIPSLTVNSSIINALPFPILLLTNIFIVGAVYIIFYAIGFALTKSYLIKEYIQNLNDKKLPLIGLYSGLLIFTIITAYILQIFEHIYFLVAMITSFIGLILIWELLKIVQNSGFVWEIDTAELEPGDMLLEPIEGLGQTDDSDQSDEIKQISLLLLPFISLPVIMYFLGYTSNVYYYLSFIPGIFSVINGAIYLITAHLFKKKEFKFFKSDSGRIRGLTEEEVQEIKDMKDTVKIREGVRFCPVFPIAIIITLVYGNLINLILFV